MVRTSMLLALIIAIVGCRAVAPTSPVSADSHILVATAVAPEPGVEVPEAQWLKGVGPLTRPLALPPAPATLSATRNAAGDVVFTAEAIDHGVFGELSGWFASVSCVYLPGGTRAYRISDGERSGLAPSGRAGYWVAMIDSDTHAAAVLTEFPTATSVRITVPGVWIPAGATVYWGVRAIDVSGYEHADPEHGLPYERGFRL